jgi:hypothetical protein
MKLGMSILDTFHERKLKQLNQRLQSMILKHFSNEQINIEDIQSNQKNFLRNFYQNFHQKQFYEKDKYFQQLHENIQQVTKTSTLFNPIGKSNDFILNHLILFLINSNWRT